MKHIIKHSIRGIIFACAVLIALPLYADDTADSLIGVWEGRSVIEQHSYDSTLTIRRNAETGKLVGAIDLMNLSGKCSVKQSAKIYAHSNKVGVHGIPESDACGGNWPPESFELTLSPDGNLLTGARKFSRYTAKITFYKQ